jgi:integrase
MAKPHPDTFRSTANETRHCKEDALTDREFEEMYSATHRLDNDYFAVESRLILFAAGRLGLRVGEITHFREDWIDWRSQMIQIPRHDSCTMGRDTEQCGYCRQAARRMSDYHGMTMDEALAMQWRPKTEASAREIPYDVSTRTTMAIEEYFDRFDTVQASSTGISRRVNALAETADNVDPGSTYPHCLRATAASHWAARGLNAVALKSMMGWSDFSVALKYIEESGARTAQALDAIQS